MSFYTWFYTLTCFYITCFSTSRFSKLISFTFDLVHSLSIWFTHSLISSLFRLGTALVHLRRGENLQLSLLGGCSLSYPLDRFMMMMLHVLLTSYDLSFRYVSCVVNLFDFRFVLMGWEWYIYFMMFWDDLLLGHPERDLWIISYKLYFITRDFWSIYKQNSIEFLVDFWCLWFSYRSSTVCFSNRLRYRHTLRVLERYSEKSEPTKRNVAVATCLIFELGCALSF